MERTPLTPRSSAQVLKSIEAKSASVREAAESLDSRIRQFEKYLSQVPGRVETFHFGNHPDNDPNDQWTLQLVLKFHRDGKEWKLACGSYHEHYNGNFEEPVQYKPLVEAPLKIKVAALKMFPDLLESIEKQQDTVVEAIRKTTAEFDAFAASLGMPCKEGK